MKDLKEPSMPRIDGEGGGASSSNQPNGIPRSRYLLGLSLVVLTLSLIEILDLFELPFENLMASLLSPHTLSGLSLALAGWGYPGLFALMLLESASLPIPSEVVLPFAGYLVYKGLMSLPIAIAVATVAGLAGALVDYYLALRLGRPALQRALRWFGVSSGSLYRAESWFNARGRWSVLIARFIPGLRSIISFPAGLFEMSLFSFTLLTFIGALGWTAVLVYLGYAAGTLWQSQLTLISTALTELVVVAAAALSAGYILFYYLTGRAAGPA